MGLDTRLPDAAIATIHNGTKKVTRSPLAATRNHTITNTTMLVFYTCSCALLLLAGPGVTKNSVRLVTPDTVGPSYAKNRTEITTTDPVRSGTNGGTEEVWVPVCFGGLNAPVLAMCEVSGYEYGNPYKDPEPKPSSTPRPSARSFNCIGKPTSCWRPVLHKVAAAGDGGSNATAAATTSTSLDAHRRQLIKPSYR
ncbi:hypothetical protein Vafri_5822 [Volvox africanus]|nr:hypothetical protein Vafri_5822 [Volvox africanus]